MRGLFFFKLIRAVAETVHGGPENLILCLIIYHPSGNLYLSGLHQEGFRELLKHVVVHFDIDIIDIDVTI